MYEGEVTELSPVETENPGGGYGKVSGKGRAAGWACGKAVLPSKACHDSHTDMPLSSVPPRPAPPCPAPRCPVALCVQVVSHVVIGLKTVKGTKQLKLDPTIHDSLQVLVAA